ncbi:hypothetical protein MPL3356_70240 [Mesorhizobium plurifarium]|uniref:Uncharacterized protein n=1 Tax=Mesorhizobium plurifarium TaxID=69974 RepID=A0A090EHG1_MESPL|nr:hypothetical protein MPL3356_70240 [Mesorhizobium plurifarium]
MKKTYEKPSLVKRPAFVRSRAGGTLHDSATRTLTNSGHHRTAFARASSRAERFRGSSAKADRLE